MPQQPSMPRRHPAEVPPPANERQLERKDGERPSAPEQRPAERAARWQPATRATPERRRDSSRCR